MDAVVLSFGAGRTARPVDDAKSLGPSPVRLSVMGVSESRISGPLATR